MTLYPLDAVRNAPTRPDLNTVLESIRTDIAARPAPSNDDLEIGDVLAAFDESHHRLASVASMLLDLRGARGADIGAGLGFATSIARKLGLSVTATERRPSRALAAADGPVLEYTIGCTPPPFEAHSLDFVLFSEVLEHVNRSPVFVLNEITELLRPGGRLVLTTPNVARLAHIEALAAGENFLEPFAETVPHDTAATDWIEHVREYSVREVVEAVEAVGLGIEWVMMAAWGDGDALLANPYANDIIVVRASV